MGNEIFWFVIFLVNFVHFRGFDQENCSIYIIKSVNLEMYSPFYMLALFFSGHIPKKGLAQ